MKKQSSLAPIFMIISALSFSIMSASVKYASDIPFIQKVFFRNIIMLFITLPIIILKVKETGFTIITGQRVNRLRLFSRTLFGFSGVLCYFYSISKLPLGDSAIINKLSAFFVIIIASIFLKEKIKSYQLPALIVAFIGTLLIIKPGFNITILPAMVGLGGAIFAASAYTTIASIRGKEKPETIILWFSGISTIASLIPAITFWHPPMLTEIVALIFTGIFAAGGQFFLTKAYSMGNAGEISIYIYTQVVFSLLIDLILWKEPPDILSISGSFLIILAALWLYKKRMETRTIG